MYASDNVNVYYDAFATKDTVDNEHSVLIGDTTGAIVWYREGQMVPPGLHRFFTFNVEEAQQTHSVGFVDRLSSFARDQRIFLDTIDAIKSVSIIHASVRDSVAQHESNWGNFSQYAMAPGMQ